MPLRPFPSSIAQIPSEAGENLIDQITPRILFQGLSISGPDEGRGSVGIIPLLKVFEDLIERIFETRFVLCALIEVILVTGRATALQLANPRLQKRQDRRRAGHGGCCLRKFHGGRRGSDQ